MDWDEARPKPKAAMGENLGQYPLATSSPIKELEAEIVRVKAAVGQKKAAEAPRRNCQDLRTNERHCLSNPEATKNCPAWFMCRSR